MLKEMVCRKAYDHSKQADNLIWIDVDGIAAFLDVAIEMEVVPERRFDEVLGSVVELQRVVLEGAAEQLEQAVRVVYDRVDDLPAHKL